MYLKKLTENKQITIDYDMDGTLKTVKGRIKKINLIEQMLFLKDEKQQSFQISLSKIKSIY